MTIVLETLYEQPIIILGFEGNIKGDDVLEGYMRSMELASSIGKSIFRIVDLRAIEVYHDEIVKVIRAAVMITSNSPKEPEALIAFVGTQEIQAVFSSTQFTCFTDIDSAIAFANKQLVELQAIA